MRTRLNRLGIPLGVVAAIGIGAYVSGSYVPGNYAQSGGYTGAVARLIDAAVDGAPDASTTTTMSVAIADSADPVISGADAYSYAVTLTNTGALTATTVSVATTLDTSLAYVSSSGTGWVCSYSAPTVTCTAATIAVGAAPTITINVTTGTGAVAASSSVVASAANASNATGSQGTTVQLVSKDATGGKYFPASSTEWTNFIARKGLAMSAPDSAWDFQMASGNASDLVGSLTLTATGSPAYQQTVTGFSRKAAVMTLSAAMGFRAASGTGPNPTTTSSLWLGVVNVTGSAAGARSIIGVGGAATSTEATYYVVNTTPPNQRIKIAGAATDGAVDLTTAGVVPISIRYDRTNSKAEITTPSALTAGTYSSSVTDGLKGYGACISSSAGFQVLYGAMWSGAHAENTDANLKALEQALGWTITR